ncbi:hypothetical protein PybrP1_000334 [[Pythium] brassicae (nom. inval.)]|nr:hypothetical protein PybrP1_000334 [[Pythium] brassicae (nom. inval.)]
MLTLGVCIAAGVDAACAPICSRSDVYGFGANGASRCLCADRLTTGCNCSNCYLTSGDGTIQTYAYDGGKCPWNSVDCCAYRSADTSDGMQTWQIVLIICCAALVFAVAMMALMSCYCKARRRLNESENLESDVGYYHQPPLSAGAPGSLQGGGTPATAAMTNSSRRSSLGVDNTADYYDTNRQLYAKAPAAAYAGSYPGSESRYTTAIGSASSSPDRPSPALSRPSAGSIGDSSSSSSSSSFVSDRRRGSSVHSQAVTL